MCRGVGWVCVGRGKEGKLGGGRGEGVAGCD